MKTNSAGVTAGVVDALSQQTRESWQEDKLLPVVLTAI